jgi:hypothetical protein
MDGMVFMSIVKEILSSASLLMKIETRKNENILVPDSHSEIKTVSTFYQY